MPICRFLEHSVCIYFNQNFPVKTCKLYEPRNPLNGNITSKSKIMSFKNYNENRVCSSDFQRFEVGKRRKYNKIIKIYDVGVRPNNALNIRSRGKACLITNLKVVNSIPAANKKEVEKWIKKLKHIPFLVMQIITTYIGLYTPVRVMGR